MHITKLQIKNYKSFDSSAEPILFYTPHSILVGKNNAGKSNILSALEIVLGPKNPNYLKLPAEDFHDISKPVEIEVTLGGITTEAERKTLFGLPNLTKPQMGALGKKELEDVEAHFSFQHFFGGTAELPLPEQEGESSDEEPERRTQFEVKLWGFSIHRKVEDLRLALIRMLKVPAIRDVSDDLSGSRWTQYGQLMKSILEDSTNYNQVKKSLAQLNQLIQSVFTNQKKQLLSGARVVAYVDDIDFQLTKDGNPSELLRFLEIFITEGNRKINIHNAGTGTQSAVIIGIFELALKNKPSRNRLFCVEEPEVFVHPHGVRYLGSLLRKIAADGKTQVIASTHAPALVATFSPQEIVRIDKAAGSTRVFQPLPGILSSEHFQRFMNSESAEMFFGDRVILVEGETEKHLLPALGRLTIKIPSDTAAGVCDFDRANTGIIKLNGKENLLNYLQILEAFRIPSIALLDKDYVQSPHFAPLCQGFGISNGASAEQAVVELRKHNVLINTKGETEDLIPDEDVADMLLAHHREGNKIPLEKIPELKQNLLQKVREEKKNRKTGDAFGVLFGGVGKTTYAVRISDYYSQKSDHPLKDLIRGLFKFDPAAVVF